MTIPQGPFTVRPGAASRWQAGGWDYRDGRRSIARFHDNGALDSSFDGDGVDPALGAAFISGNDIGLELQPGRKDPDLTTAVFAAMPITPLIICAGQLMVRSMRASPTAASVFPFDDYTYRGDIGLTAQGGIVLDRCSSTGNTSGRITRLTSWRSMTFGTNGTVQITAPGKSSVWTSWRYIQTAVVGRRRGGVTTPIAPYVAHVTPDGRLDPNFGENGILMLPFLNEAARWPTQDAAP